MARFEKVLRKRACPKCRKKRLIPKKPSNYKQVRCMNCGGLFALAEEAA
jgi:DNA-directed RNA polymerase subunit RPC12/RpoP